MAFKDSDGVIVLGNDSVNPTNNITISSSGDGSINFYQGVPGNLGTKLLELGETRVALTTGEKATKTQAEELESDDVYITPKKLGDAILPTMDGSATFTRSSNRIVLTGIVTALALEVGDVIQITGSANNNRLHTVESITDNNTIIVNYEHRNGAGSLSLIDETANVTIKRIAKWFNAPIGLGQAWVNVTSSRARSTVFYNTTNRAIQIRTSGYTGGASVAIQANMSGAFEELFSIAALNEQGIAQFIIPVNSAYRNSYARAVEASFGGWKELR